MKLIFLDVDGTLTRPGENTPPESAVRAIHAAQADGCKVFLCTGRGLNMLRPLLPIGFDGVISCSGGYVTMGDEILYDHPMTHDQRDLALTTLHHHGVFCTIEGNDGAFGDTNAGAFRANQPEGNPAVESRCKALFSSLGIRTLDEYDGSPIYKVVIMCLGTEQLIEARETLEDEFRFVVQEVPEMGCINGEIVSRAFDKGKGVRLIAQRLGVSLEDTYGFGDSMNDLEMIEAVGTSVCMANGSETIKARADVICPSVDEDGLARAFAELGLC